MSKSNLFETELLELLFNNAALANIGDLAGLQPSATAGSLFVALYTSDPGEADAGAEATFTGYARVAVERSAAGWTVAGDQVSNAAEVTFPKCTGGTNTITHFAVRTSSTGGDLIYSGVLSSPLAVSDGITVQFAAGALTVSED